MSSPTRILKVGFVPQLNGHMGGVYQYSQTLLEALELIQKESSTQDCSFEVTLGYTSDSLPNELRNSSLKKLAIPFSFRDRALWKVWKSSHLSLKLWRKVSPHIHSATGKIMKENCDLWIFLEQDHWNYILPVPSVTPIFDLMHRYENRFAELNLAGEYQSREDHFKRICKWSKALLVDSEVGGAHVRESYPVDEKKLHVFPYIAPSYIRDAIGKPVRAAFEKKYRLPKKFFLYPAQFWEHKNHSTLLDALSIQKYKGNEMELVLVGAPKNASKKVFDKIKKAGLETHVHHYGYIDIEDMAEMYKRSRAVIFPSFCGPTNIPPLEAMCLGVPQAVSNVYAMPSQIGDAGLLFDPNSAAELSEVLERLWFDDKLCQTLSKNALQQSKKYTFEEFKSRLQTVLNSVLLN